LEEYRSRHRESVLLLGIALFGDKEVANVDRFGQHNVDAFGTYMNDERHRTKTEKAMVAHAGIMGNFTALLQVQSVISKLVVDDAIPEVWHSKMGQIKAEFDKLVAGGSTVERSDVEKKKKLWSTALDVANKDGKANTTLWNEYVKHAPPSPPVNKPPTTVRRTATKKRKAESNTELPTEQETDTMKNLRAELRVQELTVETTKYRWQKQVETNQKTENFVLTDEKKNALQELELAHLTAKGNIVKINKKITVEGAKMVKEKEKKKKKGEAVKAREAAAVEVAAAAAEETAMN
jgi:hypothetical protein